MMNKMFGFVCAGIVDQSFPWEITPKCGAIPGMWRRDRPSAQSSEPIPTFSVSGGNWQNYQ
jgi:hypothetical protein